MSRLRKIQISRGTKPFGAATNGFGGGFPRQFLPWVREMGWLNGSENICWLCSGGVKEPGVRVDIRPETNPDVVRDATDTGLESNRFDFAVIDPPYSKELAKKLYGTAEFYYSINVFLDEAVRITRPGGNIITLSYECPKIPKGCAILAVWGVYQIPLISYMRCFCVFQKKSA